VDRQVDELARTVSEETTNRERQVAELHRWLDEAASETRRMFDELAEEGARIDARALPIIGLGIVLSGMPDEVAALPLGWLCPSVGLLFAGVLTGHWWREHQRRVKV
jgi:hypothetical protein